jgi:hypothetical protein
MWYPALSCPPQDGLPGHAEQVCNVIWLERLLVARNPACNAEQFRARGQFVVDVQVRRYRCRIFHELFYLPCLRGRITIPGNLLHCRQTVFVPALIGHGIIRTRGKCFDFRNHSLVYPALTSGQILTQGPFCSLFPYRDSLTGQFAAIIFAAGMLIEIRHSVATRAEPRCDGRGRTLQSSPAGRCRR